VSAEPTLQQVAGVPLYKLSSSGEAAAPGFWAGYRSGGTGWGSTATLRQAWEDRGAFVFLGAEPADWPTFSRQLEDVLSRISPAGLVRAIWIAEPKLAEGNWQLATLETSATGSGSTIAWTVARAATFAAGEYAVEVEAGTPLKEAGSGRWGIALGGLTYAGPQAGFAAAAGSAWLPLAGPQLGCWRAKLTLPAGGGDGLGQLGTMICFAAPRRDGKPGDAIEALEMPVLAQGAAALDLYASFDWLSPLAPERTRFGFFADDGSGATPSRLRSTLRTSRGYSTELGPRAYGAPLRAARLVLCQTPAVVEEDPRTSSRRFHLAPDGAFDLTVASPSNTGTDARQRLMFGLSGLEYALLPTVSSGPAAIAHFSAGMNAFAPGAAPAAPEREPGAAEALTDRATTAHLAVLPPASGEAGLAYYAQPRQAPLFAAEAEDATHGFLDYLEIPAGQLPGWSAGSGSAPAPLPAAPLAGVSPGDGALARRIEAAALAPARRQEIGTAPAGLGTALANGTMAVTPQGLLVEAGTDKIERIAIAALPSLGTGSSALSQVSLTGIGPKLRAAIQANELFFVVGDPDAYMADSSVLYLLDAVGLTVLQGLGMSATMLEELRVAVTASGGSTPKLFATEAKFDEAVTGIVGKQWLEPVRRLAGFLRPVLSDWTFQLSPRSWRRGEAPTIMLFKFCNRSLVDLIEDGAAWGWPGMPKAAATQKELQRIVSEARKAREREENKEAPADDPYAAFYREVLANPEWNGVLFLNAPISISELPPELQFLAAGIDADRFYAHHIGFAATPVAVESGAIAIRRTAAFALVDYQDPDDLVLSPTAPNPEFNFKTLRLTARFANAALVDFQARAELMVNRLLAAPLTKLEPTHGNNLPLTGSSQRQGGKLSYAFALEGEHRYATDRTVLESVEVDTVQMLTTAAAPGSGQVGATFVLGGYLRFVDGTSFDPFCYGAPAADPKPEEGDGRLRFDNLGIEMRFPLGQGEIKEFSVALSGTRFDTDRSHARRRSLIHNFPVSLSGLASSSTQAPQDVGFGSISAPLEQSPLSPPWYGLTYTLDLGTLGALSGSTPLSLTLLAAWGAGDAPGSRPAYLGLVLPEGLQWSLQSVIKLGFRSIQFTTSENKADASLAYLLRLRRFALTLLGIALPPGNLDITLFGDSKHPESRTVGWYAAYEDEASEQARLEERV
jgi:hypothetical protein